MENNKTSRPYTFDRVVRMVLTVLGLVAAYFVLSRLSEVLIPFFIALLLAYFINPLVGFIQNKVGLKNRMLSVIASLIVVVAAIYFIYIWLVPQFISEFGKIIHLFAEYIQSGKYKDLIGPKTREWLSQYLADDSISTYFEPKSMMDIAKKVLGGAWNVFSGSINFIVSAVSMLIIIVYLIFLLVDFKKISQGWIDYVPENYRRPILAVFHDMNNAMHKYFRAQGLIALIVGILFAIGFKIIGLPMGITIGLFMGVLNLVPYLQIAGILPVIILCMLKSIGSPSTFWEITILSFIVIGIVQVIQDTVLTPRIMGKSFGMHPAIILLSLSIWGSLLGLLGMIIALPLTTLIMSYYKRFVLNKEQFMELDDHTYKPDDPDDTLVGTE